MKAAFLTTKEKYEIQDMAAPVLPDDGILLQVKACGVCGSDLRRWKEGPPTGSAGLLSGHEIAGVVVAVGANAQRYNLGDRLAVAPDVHCGECFYCRRGMFNLCDNLKLIGITPGYAGGFAQQMILTREILENGIVHPIPEGMSFREAALAEPCSSVLAAHAKAGTNLEHVVVVMGAGPIGCLHIAVAHVRGARVILSEPSAPRRIMAQRFAPDLTVDPMHEDLNTRVREFTRGIGADIVICANPIATTQTQAVEIVRKGGRVVLFGGLPKANPETRLDGNRIHYGEITITGAFSYHPSFHQLALDVIGHQLISARQVITHTFSLDQIDEAFAVAASGDALKVIVEPER